MAGAKSHYLEMFHIFLNTIRPDHPRHIYESMRNIMTSVIEEYDGDEISAELLKPLLASVRRDNMNVSPVAWELGTAVIQKCAIKLKPLLQEAVRSMNLVVDDYADIVISLCRDTSSGEIMDGRKTSEALQFDEGVQNDGSLSVTLRSNSEQIKLSDTDEVTSHNMEHVAAFVIDTSLRSFQRKKRTKTNLTRELAGPSDSSRQEFLSGACSSKGLHFKQKNKSLNDQAGESSSRRKPTKAMSGKKLSQEMGKKPETNAAVEYGDELVNKRIMVFWPAEKAFFTGTITAFDPVNKKHTVTYDYGDVKVLNLKEEKWEPFKYSMFVDRRPQKFVQSSKEEKTNHPPPAKESLKSREKAESRKVGLSINEDAGSSMKRLKRDDHDVLHFRGDSVSAQNVVLVADMPISQRSEENNAGHENQTEPSRRISSRSTKGYHYKQRFGRFFS